MDPLLPAQAPAHYRIAAGDRVVTAFCDGHLALPPALFAGAGEAEIAALTTAAFLPPGPVATPVNVFALEAAGRRVLIDAGMGAHRGPATGRLPAELRAAGLDPAGIDAVLLTHLHGDHCGGLTDVDGAAVFPNAELLVSAPEHAFWSDPGLAARMPEAMQPTIRLASAALAAYAGRLTVFSGAEPLPGIRAVPLPGHTPGMTGYVLGDGALFIWADIIHVAAFQFAHPEWRLAFDVDPAQAAATRARVFDRVASDRQLVAGMHLGFPGLGHVAREAAGCRFVPAPWQPLD